MIYDNFLLTRIHHYLSTIIHPDFLLGIILDSNQICPGSEGKRGAPQPALAHWVGVTDTILVFTQLKRLAEDGGFRTGLGNNAAIGNVMKKYTGTTCFRKILLLVFGRSDNFMEYRKRGRSRKVYGRG
jgi:hypothetical protein